MRSLLVVLGCLVLLACDRPDRRAEEQRVDLSLISIASRHRLRTDLVGADAQAKPSTFVLVDAENRGDEPLDVWLGGVLVDADGRELGGLRVERLMIPQRGKRTFALVDAAGAVRPNAVGANIDVRGARRWTGPELIKVTQGHAYEDYGKIVVTGMVVNAVDRPCLAVIIAGFHDADGVPMTRPFSMFQIGGGQEKPTRFVGPEGSTRGYIYVGDVQCWAPPS